MAEKQRSADPDSIKMFVGQIPKVMSEGDLVEFFSAYGHVYQLKLLKEPNGQSKGCCFVTFYTRKSAVEAQAALHNLYTFPNMKHPVQMKPAESDNHIQVRRLFIGMIGRKMTESDLKEMFSAAGVIEDCSVLRDNMGMSKGCAFVTMSTRQQAINAINMFNRCQTFEGCTQPIVVKFADSPKGRQLETGKNVKGAESSRYGNTAARPYSPPTTSVANPNRSRVAPNYQSNSPAPSNYAEIPSGTSANANSLAPALQQLLLLAAATQPQVQTAAVAKPPAPQPNPSFNLDITSSFALLANAFLAACAQQATMGLMSNLVGQQQQQQQQQNVAQIQPKSTGSAAAQNFPFATAGGTNLEAMAAALTGAQQFTTAYQPPAAEVCSSPVVSTTTADKPVKVEQSEGPEGANLFIYHLPNEFGDSDLSQTFSPFGTIRSAKVFIDKSSGLSKCFGFVSYDSQSSAQAAIAAMNGFQIGTKRLKVSLKRSNKDAKPYQHR